MDIIIIGGGWAGCAAAFAAAMAGAGVILTEKTDMLLGTGLVGGIIRNNGRYTALEELAALGGNDFVEIINSVVRHANVDFPGHKHASLYDITKIEPVIRKKLSDLGVDVRLKTLAIGVGKKSGSPDTIDFITTKSGEEIHGSAFIDCTGTAGPTGNCIKYGEGCAMCILRCPSFGPRVSITEKSGVKEISAGSGNIEFEAMSGSCKIDKSSLEPFVRKELNEKGVMVVPLPENLHKKGILGKKACQQYALDEFARNLVILDTGHAKLMTPYFPLSGLRTIEGFQNARYADPYSGGIGNSIRFMAIAPCNNNLKVDGMTNLFCAGEKTGPLVGHTEAMITGMLAGHNAVRIGLDLKLLELPESLAAGDIIAHMHKEMQTKDGLKKKYTFSGSCYYERMKEKGLYTINIDAIRQRVRSTGLEGIFCRPLF